MKPVNLYMLASRPDTVPASSVESMMSFRRSDVFMRDAELEDIAALTHQLVKSGASIQALAGFFCSYVIEHIGKEFDLLKVASRRMIFNIELKSQNKHPADMEQQLQKNAYYLRGLGLPMMLFAWLKSTNTLYELRQDRLEEVPMSRLAQLLNQWSRYKYEQDLDALFLPELYLVSPMNNPRRFLQNNYFLTAHQNALKKEILEKGPALWSIYGEAGTGKTLFLLDLARTLAQKDPVLFLHNGHLQKGHAKIMADIPNLEIRSAFRPGDLQAWTHIIADDAQRLSKDLLGHICTRCMLSQGYGIFGYDPRQILTWQELSSPVCTLLETDPHFHTRRLTRRIRCNASLAAFAASLFQTSRMLPGSVSLEDLECLYADEIDQAREICLYYQNQGYVTISYCDHLESASIQGLQEGESLLGQEYDKVLAAADNRFQYVGGKLISTVFDPLYIQENLLYQGLARTRKKLVLLCVRNKPLYEQVLFLQQQARGMGSRIASHPL